MNVYIFKCSDGTYKIGKANDIAQRKPQVEKEFGIKAEIYAWKPIADTFKFETMLHRKFQHYRSHHEFFDLTKDQVHDVIQEHCFTVSINTIKSEITVPETLPQKAIRNPNDIERIIELEKELAAMEEKYNWFYITYYTERLKKEVFNMQGSDRNDAMVIIEGMEVLLSCYGVPSSVIEIENSLNKKKDTSVLIESQSKN